MPSIGSILNIARNAIHAHQSAMAVASQNVANAQTEGYSRQRVLLYASTPELTPQGSFGTGVVTTAPQRVRETLLDTGYRTEAGRASGYGVRHELLSQIEGLLGEPSETGLSSTLAAFWSAWSDLAGAPTSDSARAMVRQRGQQVAEALNGADARLSTLEEQLRMRLTTAVDQVNSLARQIADLNVSITASEAGGAEAPDLRDARDRLLDQVAKLGSVRVTEQRGGSITLQLDGATLVDGSSVHRIEGPGYRNGKVTLTVDGDPLKSGEGSAISAMVKVLNDDVNGADGIRARLDALAAGLVDGVNALHRRGWSPGAAWDASIPGSGVDFFDSTATGARTAHGLSLSQAVRDDARSIATGYAAGGTSDTRLALDLAGLRDAQTTMTGGTQSFEAFHRDTVTGLALRTASAENSAGVHETLAAQADNRRQSVSGVSTDEELIRIMQHQQAYAAAGKLLKVADEMMQTLLNF
jgi:flagellar hook-associated protein 1 FlgK